MLNSLFRSYGWPRQDYLTEPVRRVAAGSTLPANVASAYWQKRSDVLGVLEGRLPLEFADPQVQPVDVDCNRCEVIVDETNEVVYNKAPAPDVPVTQPQAEPTSTRARTGQTPGTVPVETGASYRRSHARHQDFHKRRKGFNKSV